jgi:hypothetical protein
MSIMSIREPITLGRPGEVGRIPFPKRRPSPLPKVLTVNELTAFFAALRKPKYRALFMTPWLIFMPMRISAYFAVSTASVFSW